MPRRSRIEKRLLAEQDTVGALRQEKNEQDALTASRKIEPAQAKARRQLRPHEQIDDKDVHPPRIGRVGKPLKR